MRGGGANSELWRQIVATTTERRVRRSEVAETACLGVGILAATGAGFFPTIDAAADVIAPTSGPVTMPRNDWSPFYEDQARRHADLHPALSTIRSA